MARCGSYHSRLSPGCLAFLCSHATHTDTYTLSMCVLESPDHGVADTVCGQSVLGNVDFKRVCDLGGQVPVKQPR